MEQFSETESYFNENSTFNFYGSQNNEATMTTDVTVLAKSYLTYKLGEYLYVHY